MLIVHNGVEGIYAMQYNDPKLKEIISILKINPEDRTQLQTTRVKQFVLKDNFLYRVIKEGKTVKYL